MQATNITRAPGDVVSVAKAAELMGVGERWIQKSIDSGKIQADTAISQYGGGASGTAYRVYVDSLPAEAQIKYFQESALAEVGAGCRDFDLVGYRERKGEDGMAELLRRQKAALAAHGLRLRHEARGYLRGYTEALEELAEALGVPKMTLYRWERAYAEKGLAGIARPVRVDAGQSRSMCLLARDLVECLMCDQRKPTQTTVLRQVREAAAERGPEACEECPYRRASAERNELIAVHGDELPLCDEAGNGMIPPDTRYAVNRAVALIPQSVLAYARYGSRYWEANYMQKTKREKPEMINECWFGDHHKLDLFVVDRDGRIVRPWLTGWMDAKSGALVGWMLTLEPNSDTIAESFARAVVATKGSPFIGLPRLVYIDNGKDYRSLRFEGSQTSEYSIGRLNAEFCEHGMLETLGVDVIHAIPYRAWAKPIERLFGTLENCWLRSFPGWCGDSPESRPQDLGRELKRMAASGELMTFATFAECFKADVIDRYHETPGEDGLSPLERYQQGRLARTDHPDWAMMSMLKSQQIKRTVTYQGIRLQNQWYQDLALADLVGKEVTVLYQRGENEYVTIMYNGRFVCVAEPIETMRMVETDREKLGRHMANQQRQRRNVKGRIASIEQSVRSVKREAFSDEIDEQRRGLANVGSVEGRKAQKAKADVDKRRRRRRGELEEGERRVQDMFGALYDERFKKAKGG